MSELSPVAPVFKTLDLDCPVEHAFRVFTRQLDTWWPLASHSCFGDAARRVEIDEQVGGGVWEIASDGKRALWGTILEWQPPFVFAMTWHPGSDPELATRLRVSFQALPNQHTRLDLLHDGWQARTDDAEHVRNGYESGWDVVLGGYRARAIVRKTG